MPDCSGPSNWEDALMNRITLAALASAALAVRGSRKRAAEPRQRPDQDHRPRQQDLPAGRRGRQHHARGRHRRHHHGGHPVRAAARQAHGRHQGDLAAADQICDHDPLPRRPYRRPRRLPEGRHHRPGAGQHPHPPDRRHHERHLGRQDGAALGRCDPEGNLYRRHEDDRGRRPQGDAHALSTMPIPTATPESISRTPT